MAYAFTVAPAVAVDVGGVQHLVYEITETDVGAANEWNIPGLPPVFTITSWETVIVTPGGTVPVPCVAPEVGYEAAFTTAVRSLIARISDVAQPYVSRELSKRVQKLAQSMTMYGRTRVTNDGVAIAGGVVVTSILTRIVVQVGHLADYIPQGSDPVSFKVTAARAFAADYVWSDPIPMTGFRELLAVCIPTVLGDNNTTVTVVVEWGDDDGIVFDGTATQRADDSISAGVFNPNVYTAAFTEAALAVGNLPVPAPMKATWARIGVKGAAAGGQYTVRAQRLA